MYMINQADSRLYSNAVVYVGIQVGREVGLKQASYQTPVTGTERFLKHQ
jgi:hypothetical protein